MTLNDPTKRALRTLAQASTVAAVLAVAVAFGVPLTEMQVGAIMALATPLLSAVQNLLEEAGTVPTLLK